MSGSLSNSSLIPYSNSGSVYVPTLPSTGSVNTGSLNTLLQNNNPAGIRSNNNLGLGVSATDYNSGYAIFPDIQTGVNAAVVLLKNIIGTGVNTAEGILSGFSDIFSSAPSEIENLCNSIGIGVSDVINLTDNVGGRFITAIASTISGANLAPSTIAMAQTVATQSFTPTAGNAPPINKNISPATASPTQSTPTISPTSPPGYASRSGGSVAQSSPSNGCGGGMTGLQLGVAATVAQNGGFASSTSLTSSLNSFSSAPPVAIIASTLATGSNIVSNTPSLTTITPSTLSNLQSIGSTSLPSVTGVVPSSVSNLVSNKGSLVGSIESHVSNIIGGGAAVFSSVLSQVAGGVQSINGLLASAGQAVSQTFGDIVNGVDGVTTSVITGANSLIQNADNSITGGLSSLTNDSVGGLKSLGSDFMNLGSWGDLTDLPNLLTAPQIMGQISTAGLLTATGLAAYLASNNQTPATITQQQNAPIAQAALDSVTNPSIIASTQSAFNSNLNIQSLGQLTNANMILSKSAPSVTFNGWADLGSTLSNYNVGRLGTMNNLGQSLQNIEQVGDLNYVMNTTSALSTANYKFLVSNVGINGGQITASDVIGSVGGQNITDSLNANTTLLAELYQTSPGQQVKANINILSNLVSGQYNTGSHIALPNGMTFSTLDTAVAYQQNIIETELTSLVNSTDPNVQPIVSSLETNYNITATQLATELKLQNQIGLNTSVPNNLTAGMNFAQSIPTLAQSTGTGSISELVNKTATNDLNGQTILAAFSEARNSAYLNKLGIASPQTTYPNQPSAGSNQFTKPTPGNPNFISSGTSNSTASPTIVKTLPLSSITKFVSNIQQNQASIVNYSSATNDSGSGDFAIAASRSLLSSQAVSKNMGSVVNSTPLGNLANNVVNNTTET